MHWVPLAAFAASAGSNADSLCRSGTLAVFISHKRGNTCLSSRRQQQLGDIDQLNQIGRQETEIFSSAEDERSEEWTKALNDYYDPSTNPSAEGMSTEELMAALGTSPRRILLSSLGAGFIAFTGNLFGVTSAILNTLPEDSVESWGVDTYYPRGDYKRCKTSKYTFVIPKEWVADTAVELAKAQQRTQQLDFAMRRSGTGLLPDSAYGPPGRLDATKNGISTGDTNVSVLRTSLRPGFSLPETMVSPTQGAQWLLDNSIAPASSGRVATLLAADKTEDGLYRFEYSLDRGNGRVLLRCSAILGQRESELYTVTVLAPETAWEDRATQIKLRRIVDSFHFL